MEQLFNKLENYNVLNYILPAIVFIECCKYYVGIDFNITNNIIIDIFMYYFIGLIISRISSLIVEPLLLKFRIINKKEISDKSDFYRAEKEDSKIKILFTDYNMYRNLITVFILLIILKLYKFLQKYILINSIFTSTMVFIFLLILFILSYRKQLKYIHSRVENVKKDS